ncbi:hypothetical protein B0H11DRAFT_1914257 [Mycena galericulata]|nr:hypothetical protein B0H11DRAFT_1914257 [Mycena galericulata]
MSAMIYIRNTIIALLVLSTHVLGQTLYDVSAFSGISGTAIQQPISVTISAAGVGVDGETTYVAVGVESGVYNVSIGSETVTLSTLSPEPTTLTGGFSLPSTLLAPLKT